MPKLAEIQKDVVSIINLIQAMERFDVFQFAALKSKNAAPYTDQQLASRAKSQQEANDLRAKWTLLDHETEFSRMFTLARQIENYYATLQSDPSIKPEPSAIAEINRKEAEFAGLREKWGV